MWRLREDSVPRLGEVTPTADSPAISRRRHRSDTGGVRILAPEGSVALVRFGDRTVAEFPDGEHDLSHDDVRYLCDGDADPITETWFVPVRPLGPIQFGGELDDTALSVSGEVAVRVNEPAVLVGTLAATVDLPNWEALRYWLSKQALHAARRTIQHVSIVEATPTDQLAARLATLESETLTSLAERLAGQGMAPAGDLMLRLTSAASCPTCSAAVPRWARYCPACGAGLASRRRCRSCQAAALASARYCTDCGAMLDEP